MINNNNNNNNRHAHQVTAATLYILQRRAYSSYLSSIENELHVDDFESWCAKKCRLHPQFQYWSLTLKLELLILSYVKSLRMSDFNLYVDSISELVPWFFALNHHHYARWATVHLCDMIALPVNHTRISAEFQAGKFTVHRSNNNNNNIRLFHKSDKPQILTKDNYMKYNTNIRELIKVKIVAGGRSYNVLLKKFLLSLIGRVKL